MPNTPPVPVALELMRLAERLITELTDARLCARRELMHVCDDFDDLLFFRKPSPRPGDQRGGSRAEAWIESKLIQSRIIARKILKLAPSSPPEMEAVVELAQTVADSLSTPQITVESARALLQVRSVVGMDEADHAVFECYIKDLKSEKHAETTRSNLSADQAEALEIIRSHGPITNKGIGKLLRCKLSGHAVGKRITKPLRDSGLIRLCFGKARGYMIS